MKNALANLHSIFWYPTTIFTGILTGYMVSHSIMLGRFFNWYITSGNLELLHRTYTVFRLESNPQGPYYIPLLLSLVSGTVWALLAFLTKRDRLVAVTAGLSTLWVGCIFMITKMGEAEEQVFTGTASAAMTQHYLAVNIPVHSSFAAIYLISLCLLLWSGRRVTKGLS